MASLYLPMHEICPQRIHPEFKWFSLLEMLEEERLELMPMPTPLAGHGADFDCPSTIKPEPLR